MNTPPQFDYLPQDKAVTIDPFGEVDGEFFVACRQVPEASRSPLNALDTSEYLVLWHLAQGMTYKAITNSLDLPVNTAHTQLSKVYKKLDAPGPYAAAWIPMQVEQLQATLLRQRPETEESNSVLTNTQVELLDLLDEGLTYEQIAMVRNIKPPTVNNHMSQIRKRLRLGNNVHSPNVILRRLAGASRTLAAYEETAQALGPAIAHLLRQATEQVQTGKLNELGSKVVYVVQRQSLLTELEAGSFVPTGTTEHGGVDLAGFVATLLLNRSSTRELMRDQAAQPIARKLIRQAVARHLQKIGSEARTTAVEH